MLEMKHKMEAKLKVKQVKTINTKATLDRLTRTYGAELTITDRRIPRGVPFQPNLAKNRENTAIFRHICRTAMAIERKNRIG